MRDACEITNTVEWRSTREGRRRGSIWRRAIITASVPSCAVKNRDKTVPLLITYYLIARSFSFPLHRATAQKATKMKRIRMEAHSNASHAPLVVDKRTRGSRDRVLFHSEVDCTNTFLLKRSLLKFFKQSKWLLLHRTTLRLRKIQFLSLIFFFLDARPTACQMSKFLPWISRDCVASWIHESREIAMGLRQPYARKDAISYMKNERNKWT